MAVPVPKAEGALGAERRSDGKVSVESVKVHRVVQKAIARTRKIIR